MITLREDRFSLTEGNVIIQCPTPLSQESFQDLVDWLDIVKRNIGRSVGCKEAPDEPDVARELEKGARR